MKIVIKISGEFLCGNRKFGFDIEKINHIVREIKSIYEKKEHQIGIVIGGGNLLRGKDISGYVSNVTADHVGMVSTIMNTIVLRDIFKKSQIDTECLSAIEMQGIIDRYSVHRAISILESGKLLIISCGTGNPFVTTDFALSLRGIELNADILLKATNVDGIFTSDPKENSNSKFISDITYQQAIDSKIRIMDTESFVQCMNHKKKLIIFNMNSTGILKRIIDNNTNLEDTRCTILHE